ncbi:MAG: type II secretion system secretin GspD [Deltaproteobacteria bacterium]|nr:type II secretion system secretin GspD [Deltaproteobacteria bacterium]
MTRSWSEWTMRLVASLLVLFATSSVAPTWGQADDAVEDDENSSDDKADKPAAIRGRPSKRGRGSKKLFAPGRGMLKVGDLKKTLKPLAGGKSKAKVKSKKGKGAEESDDSSKKSGAKDRAAGKGRKGDKGKSASSGDSPGAGEEDSPWSKVDTPKELEVGIEFKKPKRGTRFSFNLVDTDLIELVKIIGNITGKAFILGGKAPHIKATIYAPTKITAAEAYQAFLRVLQVNGLTIVPAGRYLKILSLGGSTSQNMPILDGKNVPPGDQIVTRLHPLEHIAAEDLAELLGRFKSSDGDITVYSPTNTLIITDYGSSIRRLLKLIRILDAPGTGEQIWIEPVNYADASELAERIMEIFDVSATAKKTKKTKSSKKKSRRGKKKKASSAPSIVGEQGSETKISKILADERTNSLIIVASETAYLRILELVKRLDVPIAGEGTLHVQKLQHADATELAKTLNNLSKSSRRSSSKKKGKGSSGADAVSLFEGEVQISADKATNSLVIVSSLRDYLSLKKVIDALDVMQRQVFVEAVIMEVSLDKNRDLGFGFHAGNMVGSGDDQSLVYGSSQPNDKLNSLLLGPGAMSGLAAGLRGPELEGTEGLLGPGISIPAFGVALQALQTNSDVNVLSTPHILATDNVEASITVGENVPVQQGYNPMGAMLGQMASSAAGSNPQLGALGSMMGGGMGGGYSISRQNVGLTLNITPHINDDDQVRLEIKLEISEVKSADSNLGPNISKKNANTTSVVTDQQTIVIGGLITDNEVETTQKVPVLGDIPILGFFFRHKSSLTQKRNLLIFLTPYIIRSAEDFREIFNRKMAERREFIERWTAFEFHRVDPHLDWSRTNGVISEINLVVSVAEEEEELKRQSELTDEVEHSPKDPIRFPHGAGGVGATGADNNSPQPTIITEPLRVIETRDGEE